MDVESLEIFYSQGGFLTYLIVAISLYLLVEEYFPLYRHKVSLRSRWIANFFLYLFSFAASYVWVLSFPPAEQIRPWSLLTLLPDLWFPLKVLVFILIADLLQYLVHVSSHHVSLLWRLHVTHHSDLDIDSTTTFRHHPLENFIDLAIRLAALVIVGADLHVLIVYDIILVVQTLFTHSNLKVSPRVDRYLRWVIITPDMHRVHHSADIRYTNANYATFFSFWDRMFGTYEFVPQADQKDMKLGLDYFRSDRDQSLLGLLLQPFTYRKGQSS